MRVPTAEPRYETDTPGGGGEEVPHTEAMIEIELTRGVGEVSDGTEPSPEIGTVVGSVGFSPDSDDVEIENDRKTVRCPGGVAA